MPTSVLAIDFGLRHLGLAVAEGGLAQPLAAITNVKSWPKISSYITEYAVTKIIVGLPEGPVASAALAFISQLRTHTDIPVLAVDETLSTVDSQQLLAHTSPARRRRLDHAAAAAVLLQNWLDSTSHPV